MEVKSVLVFMVKKVPKEDPYLFISVIVPDSVCKKKIKIRPTNIFGRMQIAEEERKMARYITEETSSDDGN